MIIMCLEWKVCLIMPHTRLAEYAAWLGTLFIQGTGTCLGHLFYIMFFPFSLIAHKCGTHFSKGDIVLLEMIQCSFSKRIRGLDCMTYYERLNSLGALTLTNRRSYADMTTAYKFLHHHINCTASDAGIVPVSSVTRSDGLRLVHLRPNNLSSANSFSIRSASMWNKLPSYIVNSSSLATFKRNLFSYFYCQQS